MSNYRREFIDPDYERHLDHFLKVPRGRRVWLMPNSFSRHDERIYFAGDYTWEPRSKLGLTKGSLGENIQFVRPSSAGDELQISIEDYDWDVYDTLHQWHSDMEEVRLFVEGEDIIICKLLTVPVHRELPEKLQITLIPLRGWRLNSDADFNMVEEAYGSGRTTIFSITDTDSFVVNDADYLQWIKVGTPLIIESDGVTYSRTVATLGPGASINLSAPIATLAVDDQVYTPGRYYGVFT
jgi:hypothetical protein